MLQRWDRVYYKNPKAWELWIETLNSEPNIGKRLRMDEFFDTQNIHICVYHVCKPLDRPFFWSIYDGTRHTRAGYTTRREAEFEAFEKAFDLLEEKLDKLRS